MVTTFEKMTGFGVEGYSSGSPAMVLVSVDTSTKLAAQTSSSLKAKAQGKRTYHPQLGYTGGRPRFNTKHSGG
jgi:hypothetical protein